MAFDWSAFLETQGIEYSERGPSTMKGNLYVHCPFCGEADQGKHMGVSIEGKGWGCWRDNAHRGRNPARLIGALLKCSWQEAQRLAGTASRGPTDDLSLYDRVRLAMGVQEPPPPREPLHLLPEFTELTPLSVQRRYLQGRGFSHKEIDELAYVFRLKACSPRNKDWMWRLIIPVYDEQLQLVTWTGRACGDARLRYKTLTADPEKAAPGKPIAHLPISDCLLNMHRIMEGGEFLVASEGPIDCFKLELEADLFDAVTTCFFGKAISAAQLDLLAAVRGRYKAIFLLLDPDAHLSALRMASEMQPLGIIPHTLKGKLDPGDMHRDDIYELMHVLADRVHGRPK